MNLFTLDKNFKKKEIIDEFTSVIWTERYYGDSEVELVVPFNEKNLNKLPVDSFLGIEESDEVMVLQTYELKDNLLDIKGISLTQWLNNRFVRSSDTHKTRIWTFENVKPGQIILSLVLEMCTAASSYLTGVLPMGIPESYRERLILPGLTVRPYDLVDEDEIIAAISYGPLYDTIKQIATTYVLGIQVLRERFPLDGNPLAFRVYKGLDRTRNQTDNSIVRFSPSLDSLTDVREVQDSGDYKNVAFGYSSEAADTVTNPGIAYTGTTSDLTGFDLKAEQVFADDVTSDDDALMVTYLSDQALQTLGEHQFFRGIDGQIISTNQFQYGRDFNLGDLVEMEGNLGITYITRVLEHIRSQDSTGEQRTTNVG